MQWDDAAGTLTVGERKGEYKGMIKKRKFVVTLAGGKSKTITYTGKAVKVKML